MFRATATTAVPRPAIDVGGRVERLLIARQSGTGAWENLRKMLERILTANSGIPGYEELRAWGLSPLDDEDGYPERWRHAGGTRAVLYSSHGTYVLLVLGSLTARNLASDEASDPEDNFVVALYREVVAALRPRTVITGPFDRLVRAYQFGSETYKIFRSAGVEFLYYEGGNLEFGTEATESEWEALSAEAAAALRLGQRRMLEGHMSTVRDNGWPLATRQAPSGTQRSDDRTLHVDAVETRAILEVVRLVADPGFSISDATERLTADRLVPRRWGVEGIRKYRGQEFATSPHSPEQRVRKFVERTLLRLPDLAMGKHVSERYAPLNVETVFTGARRERTDEGYVHWLVWAVPDLFADVDEQVLLEAVTACAAYRLARGEPASQYLHELAARERARVLLESGDDSLEVREIKRWAGPTGRMLHAMGSAQPELDRSPLVREAIAKAEAGARRFGRKQGSAMQGLFSKFPPWRQGDTEYVLSSGVSNQGYALLRRDASLTMSRANSLWRAWGIKKGVGSDPRVLASLPTEAFHMALARAAAVAIDSGVPILRNQHVASARVGDAGRDLRLRHLAARQQLENELQTLRDRADAALEMAIDAKQQRRGWERATAAVERASRADGTASIAALQIGGPSEAMVEHMQRKADEAFSKIEDAKQKLAAFEESSHTHAEVAEPPSLDDMTLVLDALVEIAARTTATPRECRVLQALFTRLEVESVDALSVCFSFDLLLPAIKGRGRLQVGPILVDVPTMGRRRPGGMSQPHAYAEAYCLHGELPEYSPHSRQGKVANPRKEVLRTIKRFFHAEHALSQAASNAIVGHPLPLVRRLAYMLVTGMPILAEEHGVDTRYLDHIAATYLTERPPAPLPETDTGPAQRQLILDQLVATGDLGLTVTELVDRLADTLPSKNPRQQDTCMRARLTTMPTRWSRPWLPQDGRWRATHCQHCRSEGRSSYIDLVAWLPEVPGGLLCSTCLRSPSAPDSIVFPEIYRTLRSALAESDPPAARTNQTRAS